MLSIITKFEERSGDLIVRYYHQNMEAEGWTKDDILAAAKVALYAYGGDLVYKNFSNKLDDEGLATARKFQTYYLEPEL